MTIVPSMMTVPALVSTQSGVMASSTGLGFPSHNGINNLLGHLMGGVRSMSVLNGFSYPTETNATYRFKSYRHPNATLLGVAFTCLPESSDQACVVTLKAGTGATATATITSGASLGSIFLDSSYVYGRDGMQYRYLFANWAGGDSGICDVVLTCADGAIFTWTIFDDPRLELTSSNSRSVATDTTYPSIRLGNHGYIGESDITGPHGWPQLIEEAWGYFRPQIIGWATETNSAFSTNSASYTSVLFSAIRHAGKRRTSSDTTHTCDFWVYSWCDESTTYAIEVASSVGASSVEATGLTNTTAAWTQLSNLTISSSAVDTITVKLKVTDGAGDCYCNAISGIED